MLTKKTVIGKVHKRRNLDQLGTEEPLLRDIVPESLERSTHTPPPLSGLTTSFTRSRAYAFRQRKQR